MLSVEAPFPNPGSNAFWQGRPCRILQINRDGSLLVSFEHGQRRVDRTELMDPARVRLTPFGRWTNERVRISAGTVTPIETLQQDYFRWLSINAIEEDLAILPSALADRLARAGFERTPTFYRPWFTSRARPTVGFLASLAERRVA